MKTLSSFLLIIILVLLLVPVVVNAGPDENTTVKVVYEGSTPIKDVLDTKTDSSVRSATLASEIYNVVKDTKLPYIFLDDTQKEKVEITIKKIELVPEYAKVGYWISATRDGKEVLTHSPIWIVNQPTDVEVSSVYDDIKNEKTITLKESPLEAAQQVLAGYVSRQPLGKAEGDDVLIVYTSGNGDGMISENTYAAFATVRADVGSTVYLTETERFAGIQTSTTAGLYQIYRGYIEYNTSALPDDCTIDSGIVGLKGHITSTNELGNWSIGITGFNPATNGTAVAGDYDAFTDTVYSDTFPTWTGWSNTVYNNMTLNNNGNNYVSKIGWTNFMVRTYWDVYNDTTGLSTTILKTSTAQYQMSEHANPGDPFIEITYTPAAGGSAPVSSFTLAKPLYRIPGIMQANDTSTNTPTQWNWSWGDGTWTNGTTQNATHKYTTRGKFGVTLLTSNAFGSNTTPTATNVRIVGYENLW